MEVELEKKKGKRDSQRIQVCHVQKAKPQAISSPKGGDKECNAFV